MKLKSTSWWMMAALCSLIIPGTHASETPSGQKAATEEKATPPPAGETKKSKASRNFKVRTTAYTHTESDHLEWGRLTASGKTLQCTTRYTSAAADWSRWPLGTKFRIKGDPTIYVVDDYGSALVGTETIDIYRPSQASMNDWGVRHVEIEVLEEGCFESAQKILAARRHVAHCEEMYSELSRINS